MNENTIYPEHCVVPNSRPDEEAIKRLVTRYGLEIGLTLGETTDPCEKSLKTPYTQGTLEAIRQGKKYCDEVLRNRTPIKFSMDRIA